MDKEVIDFQNSLCRVVCTTLTKRTVMKARWMITALMALALVGMATFTARADDKDKNKEEENEKVTSIDQIPAAASTAIKKAVGQNTIDKVLQGTKDNKTYYEAQYKDGDKKMEVKVDADGKVLKKGPSDDDDKDKK